MKKIIILSLFFISNLSIVAQTINYDTITFETPSPYITIDTSGQNIWEIGIPGKVFFDTAFSPIRAMVTDTVNNYPINNYSYFDLTIDNNLFNAFPPTIFY